MAWAPPYITADQLLDYMRVADSVYEADDIDTEIEAASRAIDRACNRQFGNVATAEQRLYEPAYDRKLRRWKIRIDDLMTTDGLEFELQDADGAVTGTLDSYALLPLNAALKGEPWTDVLVRSTSTQPGYGSYVAITGKWGWDSVPGTVASACKLQASRFLNRRDSPYGVAGSPDAGSELRLLERVDPDVTVMLKAYRRLWVIA